MVSLVSASPVAARPQPPVVAQSQMHQPSAQSRLAGALARFSGTVLVLAAVGIWIVTVPVWDHAMWLMRAALSVLFLMTGMYLLQSGRGAPRDEIHYDAPARKLHHIRRGPDGIARICQTLPLEEMGKITCADDCLSIQNRDGAIVMTVSGLPCDMLRAFEQRIAPQ